MLERLGSSDHVMHKVTLAALVTLANEALMQSETNDYQQWREDSPSSSFNTGHHEDTESYEETFVADRKKLIEFCLYFGNPFLINSPELTNIVTRNL